MASSGQRGRSSSLFVSSPSRSLSSDWLVSSPPVSQNQQQQQQHKPARQRTSRRMSPARSSAANGEQPSQKRASSLVGFFSKILPSHRPEQGGTHRSNDWIGDVDIDLAANSNELTGWNLAKEKNPAYPTPVLPGDSNQRRVWSLSTQKGDSRFVENLPRERSRGREQVPDTTDREPCPPRKSEALTRNEVHELVTSKEETRKSRRSLKESGDWLGVQGADPYSGQFSVLTPTETLSSETTNTSTRSKLAGLARKKKAAKLEYEQIRLLEEQEKDKARLDKEQAKLNKIERVKEELRRQHQFARWSQHKRHWSSAAEPNLSPIAQSLDSVALGSSETSSLLFSEMPTDSFTSDADDATTPVPNFSRPTRPPVSFKTALQSHGVRRSSDSAQHQGHRRFDQSTDTIIHNTPDTNTDNASLTRPASQPSGKHLNAGQSDIGRAKSERHFLWRRRRVTDPGKPVSAGAGRVMSLTAQNLTSSSIGPVQKDHFADLAIPDYHLHLLTPETADTNTTDSQSTRSDDSPPITANTSFLGMLGTNRMALTSTTNLAELQQNGRTSQDSSAATVTSSHSKLKGIMKRPSKLVPSLLGTGQTKDTERQQASPPTFDEIQDHTVESFARPIPGYQSEDLQSDQQGRISVERAGNILPHTSNHVRPARRESVSTPITTITGYVRAQQNQPNNPLHSKWDPDVNRTNGAAGTSEVQATPTSSGEHEDCIEPTLVPEEHRTPSPATTPRSSSPSPVLSQETPETGTTSTRPATPEKKPPTRVSTPTTPRLCRIILQNAEAKDVGVQKDTDLAEKIETGKAETQTQIPKRAEVIKVPASSAEDKGEQKADLKKRRGTSPAPAPVVALRDARRRLSFDEQGGTTVEEAARIAMLRSKAREIVRSKSADRRTSVTVAATATAARNESGRTPSPGWRPVTPSSSRMVEQKKSNYGGSSSNSNSLQLPTQRRPRKRRPTNGYEDNVAAADIALLSSLRPEVGGRSSSGGRPPLQQRQKQQGKGAATAAAALEDPDPEMLTAAHLAKVVYAVLLGLARRWWAVARPAFDGRSELWGRRRREEGTWADLAVFAAAGSFCVAAALGGWFAVRVVWWVVGLGLVGL
ncbi:hypothetical protein GGR54DRAFT_568599 [Hypoxylon sp. NC1633]|nr:hypothetical protein GGR54DRAFT_568599 [Hypoxylon sp. NC1633]